MEGCLCHHHPERLDNTAKTFLAEGRQERISKQHILAAGATYTFAMMAPFQALIQNRMRPRGQACHYCCTTPFPPSRANKSC
eukprot:6046536-Amphidinium_carterae.1